MTFYEKKSTSKPVEKNTNIPELWAFVGVHTFGTIFMNDWKGILNEMYSGDLESKN